MRVANSVKASTESGMLNEFKVGLRYVGATPMILASTIAAYVISIFVGTYTRFLPVFAKDILQVGPDGLACSWPHRELARFCRWSSSARGKIAGAEKRCCGFPPRRRHCC